MLQAINVFTNFIQLLYLSVENDAGQLAEPFPYSLIYYEQFFVFEIPWAEINLKLRCSFNHVEI
jgi:hypothetical protein